MPTDNTILSTNVGTGDTVRDFAEQTTGVKWPVGVVAYVTGGSAGAWTLQAVDATHGLPVAQQGAWSVTVGAALPAGANTIGAVNLAQYTPAGGRLPVDGSGVTQPVSGTVSITANSAVNVAQVNGVAPSMGSGVTGTGVQRVTLATDVALPAGTNVLGSVNQNGTWTVQPGNTANTTPWLFKWHDGTNAMAAFFDLDTGVGTQYLPGFNLRISGNGGSIEAKGQQTMANSLPVVIASDQATLTNLVGQVAASTETGTVYSGTTALTPKRAKISCSASGENTLVAGVGGKKIRVLSIALFGVGTAVNIYFKDAAGGNAIFADGTNPIPIDKSGAAGAGGFVLGHNPQGWMETAASGALILNLSAAQAVAGALTYVEV